MSGRAEVVEELAAVLRSVAEGRREYASSLEDMTEPWAVSQYGTLMTQANDFELAAKIVEGDLSPLYGLLPVRMWSEEMERLLHES